MKKINIIIELISWLAILAIIGIGFLAWLLIYLK